MCARLGLRSAIIVIVYLRAVNHDLTTLSTQNLHSAPLNTKAVASLEFREPGQCPYPRVRVSPHLPHPCCCRLRSFPLWNTLDRRRDGALERFHAAENRQLVFDRFLDELAPLALSDPLFDLLQQFLGQNHVVAATTG